MKLHRAPIRGYGEHAVEHQRVEVDVQVEHPTKSLYHRHAPTPGVRHATTASAPALPAEERVRVHAQHRATQLMVPREQIAQPVRQAEHPLTHGHPW
jgi:hypothetical protein